LSSTYWLLCCTIPEAMHPYPQFQIQSGKYTVSGITNEPFPLWDVKDHQQNASANINNALSLPENTTPIFLGAVHLNDLLNSWPKERSAIVIEKCLGFYNFITGSLLMDLEKTHIHTITGQWGLPSPYIYPAFKNTFDFEEIGHLAYQLNNLSDDLFNKIHIYNLPELDFEGSFVNKIHQTIHLIAAAKRFHKANQHNYNEIGRNHCGKKALIIARKHDDIRNLNAIYDDIIAEDNRTYFRVDDHDNVSSYKALYSNKLYERQAWQELNANNHFKPFEKIASDFINAVKKEKPAFITYRNRAPFSNLEDCFFLEEVIRRCKFNVYPFFMDYFSQQALSHEGGWSFPLHVEHIQTPHEKIFCLDAHYAKLYSPENRKVYAFQYLKKSVAPTLHPPIKSNKETVRDIAVVHSPRLDSLGMNEINEICEVVCRLSHLEPGAATNNFLYRLRKKLKETQGPYSSFLWTSVVNLLDFILYAQSRIRKIISAVSLLKDYRIEVFGGGWEALLPPSVCAPYLKTSQELHKVYRESAITINFSPLTTFGDPAPNVIDCLASGGLPLMPYPSADDVSESKLIGEHFPCFKNSEEMINLVKLYTSNWEERQRFIHKAHSSWLRDYFSASQDNKSCMKDLLQQEPILRLQNYNPRFTFEASAENFIIDAAVGYLLDFTGYTAHALELWKTILTKSSINYAPLAVRAAKSALTIKSIDQASFFLEMARKWSPEHPEVGKLGECIKMICHSERE
jgi:hypothetical protein